MKPFFKQLLLTIVVVAFGFGVNATYEKYRGTDLSRVPR